MTPPTIHRVTELDLTLRRQPWTFADRKRVEIDAHFSRNLAEKPKLWDGRILLARNPRFGGNRFSADYFETGFASFLAWRDWGFPDHEVFNGFGMGALRCADGAFVLGEMADHTANGGRIYFPAGTPDLDDIVGASVDIAGSVAREVEEETGLTPADYRAAEQAYYRETGIYPLMHAVGIRTSLLERHPWMAAHLYNAFARAKEIAVADFEKLSALALTLPWIEAEYRATQAVLGTDIWPYGVAANRKAIDTLCRYLHEQGFTSRLMRTENLFAPMATQ